MRLGVGGRVAAAAVGLRFTSRRPTPHRSLMRTEADVRARAPKLIDEHRDAILVRRPGTQASDRRSARDAK
jgi:hypothetical protein